MSPKIKIVGLGVTDTSEDPEIMNMRSFGLVPKEIEKLLVQNAAE